MKNFLKAVKNYIKGMGFFFLPLDKVAHDKQLHALGGAWFGFIGMGLINGYIFPENICLTMVFSILLALIAGILKEVYDVTVKKSVFDYIDVVWTVLGGTVAVLILALLALIIN